MLAILSNINCDHIIRRIQKTLPCMDNVGYGNVLEMFLNPNSRISMEKPEQILILIDLREFVGMGQGVEQKIDSFFDTLSATIRPGCQYFISDAVYYLPYENNYRGDGISRIASRTWDNRLHSLLEKHSQCYIFPLRRLVEEIGAKLFFSNKLWYMGSARYSMEAIKSICREIQRLTDTAAGKQKKVLILDLDNTLWGGVAGEDGIDGIRLSDSGIGKAYKEFQFSLKQIKNSGTLLAIVSKNNEADALEIIDRHPNMILRRDDFAAYRINWENKSVNIKSLASELNVGIDSMVFIDDNPQEREEIKNILPQVAVPDFPEQPEELLAFSMVVAQSYFMKLEITAEDRKKTEQYQAKKKIEELQETTVNFKNFLDSLKIVVTRHSADKHMDRVTQLVQKTNQFNTTVTRYTRAELEAINTSPEWELFLYEVEDRFTNHGLCALVVVRIRESAVIEDFIMSCRVMGRNIEYGILNDIEQTVSAAGVGQIEAVFRQGEKNAPVKDLFDRAGYEMVSAFGEGEEKHYQRAIRAENASDLFVGEVRSGI